ncbi:MAG: hypothetical protein GOMPHAMPRED_005095 [Gomphillus americanus]|uniref:BHLH domain-containing protein n=1 Tax=Gomphillus americanus TaxID=1940652 RepID=A0A8H3EHU0_9LECA|nr:MAG: hypothetical protein GOMPHAMPRED_005095 [Gomphillus americanus]
MATSTTPLSPSAIATDFSKEDWEKWMNLDGQQQQLDASTPGTYLSGSPPPLQFVSGSLGSTSPSELESLPPLPFSPTYALPTTASKKRKSSAVAGATPGGRQPRGQKISHNVIEKRYRSNLNDKIAKLRDSVPELRVAQPTVKRKPQKPVDSNSDASGDEGQGLKFNKATVLVKATEYIQQLERHNQRLLQEVSTLKNRFGPGKPLAPAAMTTGFATATYIMPQTSTVPVDGKLSTESSDKAEPTGLIKVPADIQKLRDEVPPQPHYAPETSSAAASEAITPVTIPPFSEIQGMIPLPETWKAFRAQSRSDEHYAPPPIMSQGHELLQESNLEEDDDEEGSRWSRSRFMSRVLVGSLAGLMVMEGFTESAEEGSKIEKRGLFSLPTELLTESRGFRDPIRKRIIAFAASPRARQLLPMFIFSFLFLAICFVFLLYITPSGSRPSRITKSKDSREHIITNSTSTQNSIGITTQPDTAELTSPEVYAVKVLDWLNLSWLVFHNHDEEAAESDGFKRAARWTRFLLPRRLDHMGSSL